MTENDKKKLLAVIDPGHTGSFYNAGAVKGYYESHAVYELSLHEKAALEAYGIDVRMTRGIDADPELYERGQMEVKNGKEYQNVLFESNHTNAFNGKACGVSVIRSAHLPGSEKLGNRLAAAVAAVMKQTTGVTYNRGVSIRTQQNGTDWYGVIRGAVSGARSETQAARGPVQYAFIVEHGFHDNEKECRFLAEKENLKVIAEAKAQVIADYFQIEKAVSGEKKELPYCVRVLIDDLNIRKQPTILSETEGYTGRGVFTIVGEAEGEVDKTGKKSQWGKLKTGKGWICLDHAKAV